MKMQKQLEINFATSNKGKLREFRQILEPEIRVIHIKISYPEMRSDFPDEIAKKSAEMLAKKLKKTVVVEDSGLFIRALNGFPGTCSAYIHKRIGLDGILRLMSGIKDRACFYRSAVAYCKPGKNPISFIGEEKGKISGKARGVYGFGHDPIFIPEGSYRTYGEMQDCGEIKQFRRKAVMKLRDYLRKKKRI